MSMPEPMPVVRVSWLDSNHASGWHSVEDMRKTVLSGENLCESVGYLFHDGEDRVVLVQSVSDTGMVDAAMTIPKVWFIGISG